MTVRPAIGAEPASEINRPEVVAELYAAFTAYEDALRRHDIAALNGYFWNSAATVRYGIAEHSVGANAIHAYRDAAPAVHPQRQLRNLVITTFGTSSGSISTEFTAPDTPLLGRQSQTWIRFDAGWKIVAAHVSVVEPHKLTYY